MFLSPKSYSYPWYFSRSSSSLSINMDNTNSSFGSWSIINTINCKCITTYKCFITCCKSVVCIFKGFRKINRNSGTTTTWNRKSCVSPTYLHISYSDDSGFSIVFDAIYQGISFGCSQCIIIIYVESIRSRICNSWICILPSFDS